MPAWDIMDHAATTVIMAASVTMGTTDTVIMATAVPMGLTGTVIMATQATTVTAITTIRASTGTPEALTKLWLDDRHTISPQRARNIINWINKEDEITRRWLHLLIPKMTDEAVQAVADENLLGADTRVARQELVKRQAIKSE